MEKPVETKTNDVGFEPKPGGRRMSSARQIVQGLPQGKPVANAEPALPTITSGTRLPVVEVVVNLPSLSAITTTIKTRSRRRSVWSNKTITIETENKINGMKIKFGTTPKE
ncbi:hypothetical protein OUZ56_012919 [Daphnia magna]|uniref:Uncharacterized protein n=1 Tax=Daphnia magna TaxID=35525 RepID=A0ABQ9Z4E7_9CRUS|nr:hypothetical protein OUZ56_012919 [Daphnia magna]